MKSSASGIKIRDRKASQRHALAATRRYFLLVRRLGADIFRRFPIDTLKILLAGGASLSCQILALGVLYAYVNALESNQFLYGYPPRDSTLLFAMVALATALLFFGFTLLEYGTNITILKLCRRYQKIGAREVLFLSSKLPHWFMPQSNNGISPRHLRQILSIDLPHRSRMARVLMRAVIPTVRLTLSTAGILYINLEFSVLILVIIGFPIAGLYLVGKKIADTITSRETAAQNVYQEQLGLLTKSWKDEIHLSPGDISNDIAMGLDDSRHKQYFRRLRAKAFGQLLINTANTLGILVLMLSLGYWIFQQEPKGNWSIWLTYLIALRYFLSSLNRVAQAIIQSSRFSRQVRRLMEFITAAALATGSEDSPLPLCPEHILAAYQGNVGDLVDDDDDLDED